MSRDAKKPYPGVIGGSQSTTDTQMNPAKQRRNDYTPKKGDQRRGVGKGGKL